MVDILPSKKPRFEGRLSEELAEKADAFRKERNWRRGDLVIEAISRLVSEERIEIDLDEETFKALSEYAEEGFRSMEDQVKMAVIEWLKSQKSK